MKKPLLGLLCVGSIASALHCQATDLPPVKPNDIKGSIRFSNANPDILALLADVQKLGPVNTLTDAVSEPPFNVSAGAASPEPLKGGSTVPYTLSVKGSSPGISYTVYQRLDLGPGDYATQYYFASKKSAPVPDTDTPVTLDFEECAGLLTVNWVDGAGLPVVVQDAQIVVSGIPNTRQLAGIAHLPAPASSHSLLAEGVGSVLVQVYYQVQVAGSTDTVSHFATFETSSNCDGVTELTVAVPDAGQLGKVLGVFDILGETEVPLPEYFGTPPRSYVQLVGGEAGGSRFYSFTGTPSSGSYELDNILPTGEAADATYYKLQGIAYFRPGPQFSVLRTPALGEASNPKFRLNPGQTVDTGDLLTITPGHVTGQVELTGPQATATFKPLLQYLTLGKQSDENKDGVPDGAYAAGVGNTFVSSDGLDAKAPGADYTAADGYGAANFDGIYSPETSVFAGAFDLELGGLKSQTSIWAEPKLRYEIAHGDGNVAEEYIYQQANIKQIGAAAAPGLTVEAGVTKPLGHDLAYSMSEVCIQFHSLGAPLWYPRVAGGGGFEGVDYRGKTVAYHVDLEYCAGSPSAHSTAAADALVNLYLPEGDYVLYPLVLVASGAGDSDLHLEPFPLHVGRGERICVGTDLSVDVTAPPCNRTPTVSINGKINSASEVVKLTISGEDGKETVIGENLGLNPVFKTDYLLPNTGDCAANLVTLTATDSKGGVASRTITIRFDNTPPAIKCPADIAVELVPGLETSVVNFDVAASDDCSSPVTVVCVPPSGSAFPAGETVVQCTATDACGNQAVCSFKVTVTGGGTVPPVIRCPDDIKVACRGDRGTVVDFAVVAVGPTGAPVPVVCTPASGSVFPVGTTAVVCVATDSNGVSSRCGFNVTVEPGAVSIRKTVTIEWCGGGTLQYSDDLAGAWTDLPGVSSPYVVDVDMTHRYYRARY